MPGVLEILGFVFVHVVCKVFRISPERSGFLFFSLTNSRTVLRAVANSKIPRNLKIEDSEFIDLKAMSTQNCEFKNVFEFVCLRPLFVSHVPLSTGGRGLQTKDVGIRIQKRF